MPLNFSLSLGVCLYCSNFGPSSYPDSIAAGISCAHKTLHHNKVVIQAEASSEIFCFTSLMKHFIVLSTLIKYSLMLWWSGDLSEMVPTFDPVAADWLRTPEYD